MASNSVEVEEIVDICEVDDEELVQFVFQFEEGLDGVEVLVNDGETVDVEGPSMEKVRQFCAEQGKKNTKKATCRDVKNFSEWLSCMKFELRNIEYIPPKLLNDYMAQYFVYIRKQDGSQYQPGSLTNMFHSFSRYLKSCRYYADDERICILKDDKFEDARMALTCKRRELKKQGLGNRPHRSVPVEEEEEAIMWEKGVLGVSSPFAIQFSLWFYMTLMMGLRGRDEHRSLRFGDVKIKRDPKGTEYLEMLERASKT
jgi:hypothetical protein